MRRIFSGSSFRRAFRNRLNFSTDPDPDPASFAWSNAPKTTNMKWSSFGSLDYMSNVSEEDEKSESLLSRKRSIQVMIETAYAAQISAANALAALKREIAQESALAAHDQKCLVAAPEAHAYGKIRLQKRLTDIHTHFQMIELKKDPNDREKLPWAFPDVEIESDRIASLSIEEPLIIFVGASFFGKEENGQVTGISSQVVFYFDNKGLPLKAMLCRNLNSNKRTAGACALEYAVRDKQRSFTLLKYRIFSDDESGVKLVQERMRKLKAGERVPSSKYTAIAEALIENDSTIEFIASERNIIAGIFAHIIAKVGHPLLYDHLPYDEVEMIF